MIRVLAVDDHPVLREGVAALLENETDIELIAEADNGAEAIRQFRLFQPDVTLMDLQMPGMGGIEAISAIRAEFPVARFIVLTTFSGDVLAIRALKAGAAAYILKSLVRQELVATIRSVYSGVKRVHPQVAAEIAHHAGEPLLTSREIEVLNLVAVGYSNKRIAAKLGINDETAKGHMKSILAKLDANDRTHAVTLGIKRGIIEI